MVKGLNPNSLLYKTCFVVGQTIVLIPLIILVIFIIKSFYDFAISGKIQEVFVLVSKELSTYWFNPKWLNENQGVLAMISIISSLLPIILYLFSFKFFRDWKKEYNLRVDDISSSTHAVAISLFKIRIDLRKSIQDYKSGSVYTLTKLFRSYPLAYCINKKFQSKDEQVDDVKLHLLVVLEYIDIINDMQRCLLGDSKNIDLKNQLIINMEFLLVKINQTFAVLEKLIQKYEYQIKDWKFCIDPTFLKSFSREELTYETI